MIAAALEQLSLTVTPLRTLGTAAWQLAPALALVAAGHVTVPAAAERPVYGTPTVVVGSFQLLDEPSSISVATPVTGQENQRSGWLHIENAISH